MITSASNPKIKHVALLSSSKKERSATNTFVIEGTKLFLEAPIHDIEEVYISENFNERLYGGDEYKLSGVMLDIFKKLKQTSYEIVSDNLFKKMSDTVTPQGILCVIKIQTVSLADKLKEFNDKPVKIVALEGLQDPGNMGTIVRTSEAAGINFILAGANTVDIHSSKVVRSTMGSIFRVPVIYTDDLYRDIEAIKSTNVLVYAAHLKGEQSYREAKYSDRSMILIGNEGRGLTDEATATADTLVKIPMQGQVESLNAAVAAAILMFELSR
ncbi:MAG: RNA methyltransferase [Lachnospiraceae bacterium]|nr:RNA methyltransferase [Lachnospiraceae bacterium]